MELKNRTAILKFWAEWCQPCHAAAPAVKAATSAAGVELIEINIDEEHAIADMFGVRSIPMVIAIKNGQPVGQLVGLQKEDKYFELANLLK
jgi:thioredoxin-like negative regulator of GroEL